MSLLYLNLLRSELCRLVFARQRIIERIQALELVLAYHTTEPEREGKAGEP